MSVHLKKEEKINMGSYYTPIKFINIAKKYVDKVLDKDTVILDTSSGYGDFLIPFKNNKRIGIDIDKISIRESRKNKIKSIHTNSLFKVYRSRFGIKKKDKLLIIGNPPYNDVTSFNKQEFKKDNNIKIDKDLISRDLGISFLKSYNKLKADYVCVLHPLSYLIKEVNYKHSLPFLSNYKLTKGTLIDSRSFNGMEKGSGFPIVIAFYKRDKSGTTYDEIINFKFKVNGIGKWLKLSNIKKKSIDKAIRKYPPKKNETKISDIGLYINTYRDINSVMRNRGLSNKSNSQSIPLTNENKWKYMYIHLFKNFFPKDYQWLLGNLSPFANEKIFKKNIIEKAYNGNVDCEHRHLIKQEIVNVINSTLTQK